MERRRRRKRRKRRQRSNEATPTAAPITSCPNSATRQHARETHAAQSPEKRMVRVSPKRPQHLVCDTAAEHDDGVVNPYRMLQVRKDATHSEIKQAYRRLALWHHPQRQSTACNKNEIERRQRVFTVLAACCETLLERESRKRLDALLKGRPPKSPPFCHYYYS